MQAAVPTTSSLFGPFEDLAASDVPSIRLLETDADEAETALVHAKAVAAAFDARFDRERVETLPTETLEFLVRRLPTYRDSLLENARLLGETIDRAEAGCARRRPTLPAAVRTPFDAVTTRILKAGRELVAQQLAHAADVDDCIDGIAIVVALRDPSPPMDLEDFKREFRGG